MADETGDKDTPVQEAAERTSGVPLGIGLGVAFGVAFGVALDNIALGIALGLALGVAGAVTYDNQRKNAETNDSAEE